MSRAMDLDSATAGSLRLIHREIGISGERWEVASLTERDSNARADADAAVTDEELRREHLEDILCHDGRPSDRLDAMHQDPEFIAAQSGEDRAGLDDTGQPRCHFPEQDVAGLVAPCVID